MKNNFPIIIADSLKSKIHCHNLPGKRYYLSLQKAIYHFLNEYEIEYETEFELEYFSRIESDYKPKIKLIEICTFQSLPEINTVISNKNGLTSYLFFDIHLLDYMFIGNVISRLPTKKEHISYVLRRISSEFYHLQGRNYESAYNIFKLLTNKTGISIYKYCNLEYSVNDIDIIQFTEVQSKFILFHELAHILAKQKKAFVIEKIYIKKKFINERINATLKEINSWTYESFNAKDIDTLTEELFCDDISQIQAFDYIVKDSKGYGKINKLHIFEALWLGILNWLLFDNVKEKCKTEITYRDIYEAIPNRDKERMQKRQIIYKIRIDNFLLGLNSVVKYCDDKYVNEEINSEYFIEGELLNIKDIISELSYNEVWFSSIAEIHKEIEFTDEMFKEIINLSNEELNKIKYYFPNYSRLAFMDDEVNWQSIVDKILDKRF